MARAAKRETPSTTIRDGAGALDPRAHLDQAIGEVDDLGLPRRVFDHCRAVSQRRRHQGDVGAADRHLREDDLRPAQALRAPATT